MSDADPLDLPEPLPAFERQGRPGQDAAVDRMSTIRLLTLRASGLTYEQIAQQTGYADGSGARQAILRALDRHEAENATQLRTLENIAYEADIRVLRSIISDPDADPKTRISAIDARTRAAARHARMNGLDAPQRLTLSPGTHAELQDALADLAELVIVAGEVTTSRDLGLETDDDEHPD